MELVTSVAESTNSILKMLLLTELNGRVLESRIFVFDNWKADVILKVETELVPARRLIIKVLWLFVQQALDHGLRVGISIHIANLRHVLSFLELGNRVVPFNGRTTSD